MGTELSAAAFRRAIFERTSPSLDVVVTELVVDETTPLLVAVPEGLEVYGTAAGRYTWRRGTDCLAMSADDVRRLREERANEDWSARSAGRGGPTVADPAAVARARALLSAVPERGVAALAAASDQDLLAGLGVVHPRGSLTNAGWLMFGPRGPPSRYRSTCASRRAPATSTTGRCRASSASGSTSGRPSDGAARCCSSGSRTTPATRPRTSRCPGSGRRWSHRRWPRRE